MDSREIHEHWGQWAKTFGGSLRATTKTWTAKVLELDALSRRFHAVFRDKRSASILEVGCGNGINCIELAKLFPGFRFDGVDYVAEMVTAANENARIGEVQDQVRFFVGDALNIGELPGLDTNYDLVFTNRCLINLNSVALQKQGISGLATKAQCGGYVIMIENSKTSYALQNHCRNVLGLASRRPADFNLFLDEAEIRPHIVSTGLELIEVEDFSSLHDLMLYVLVPAINEGDVDYGHPLVRAAMTLSRELSANMPNTFGSFGQNRMFVCRKLA